MYWEHTDYNMHQQCAEGPTLLKMEEAWMVSTPCLIMMTMNKKYIRAHVQVQGEMLIS